MVMRENPTEVPTDDISSAFEILSEELETETGVVCNMGAKAFGNRDFTKSDKMRKRVLGLVGFRDQVATLRADWGKFVNSAEQDEDEKPRGRRRNLGRLRRGELTPQEEYFLPILRSLVKIGGAGKTSEIMEIVGKQMERILKDVDRQPIPSEPSVPRWRSTALGARPALIKAGLIKPDSPKGTWEITEAGLEFVKKVDDGGIRRVENMISNETVMGPIPRRIGVQMEPPSEAETPSSGTSQDEEHLMIS
jgi:restriction system protein